MSCCSNILNQGHMAHVYRGETIVCDFTLRDDCGAVITDISDAIVLITDAAGVAEPVEKRLGDGITFDNGYLRFMLMPEESEVLPAKCSIEVKVVTSGMTRIALQKSFLTMLDNQVKDY